MSRTLTIVTNTSKVQSLQLDEPGKGDFTWNIASVDVDSDKVGQSLTFVFEVAEGPMKGKSHRKSITLPVAKDDWGKDASGKDNDYSSRDKNWNRFRLVTGLSSKEQLAQEEELRANGKVVPPMNLDLDTLIGRKFFGRFEPSDPNAVMGSQAAFSNLTFLDAEEWAMVLKGTLNLKSRDSGNNRRNVNAPPSEKVDADAVNQALKDA